MSLNVSKKSSWICQNFNLINAIRRYHTNDKKKLAKVLNLSWPTLNTMLTRLFEFDDNPVFVNESGVYCIKENFGFFVGISVGALETQVSILDFLLNPVDISKSEVAKTIQKSLLKFKTYKNSEPAKILASFETPQYPQDLSTLCNKIINEVLNIFDSSTCDLLSIGLTFPGIFGTGRSGDLYEVVFCPNLSRLVGLSLIDLFDQRLLYKINENGISFILTHDTDAITVFEKENLYKQTNVLKQHSNKSNYACIYLDIGLGMGLIINNILLRGSCHSAGEIGHLIAPPLTFDSEEISVIEKEKVKDILNAKSNFTCYCGVKNCLEHELRTKVFGCNSQNEFLDKTNNATLTVFHEKHPIQYEIFKQYLSYLMNLLINILNIDVIILTGRIFNKMTPLKYDIELIKMSSGLAPSTNACKVVFGSDRTDIAAIGGAAMAFFNFQTMKTTNFNTDKKLHIEWPIIKKDI